MEEMERLLQISKEAAERQTQLLQGVTEDMRAATTLMKSELEEFRESRKLLEDFIAGLDRAMAQLTKATAALIQLYQLQKSQRESQTAE